jgi:type IX secretion system PorP/SprF family membrane protein
MKQIRILFFAIVTASSLHAQDPFFTQYNSAPLYLNPGFAGSTGQARAAASYRNQWPGISGNFVTTNISYDHYFAKLHGGLGINLQNDLAGQATIQTNRADLSYAFHLPLFDNKLVVRPAVAVGFLSKHIDWSSLNFGDMVDPRRGFVYNTTEAPSKSTVTRADFSSGFIAYTKRITVGFSAAHLSQPDVGFFGPSRLPMRFTVHASGVIGHVPGDFENHCAIVPQVAFVQQQNFTQFTGGISAMFKNYTLGIAYRNQDAAIVMVGFQNRLFRASYSYDYTVSGLTNKTMGSHELALQFFLFAKKKPEGFLAPATILF